jgi:hypothetical protein
MRLIFSFFLITTTLFTKAQNSLEVIEADSTKSKTIEITPFYSRNITTSVNYAKTITDSILFQQSSGVSLVNTLRGQIPGIILSPYVRNYPANFRGNNLEFVMDGVPYSSSVNSYYNLNSFEFSSISILSNRNALSFLDTQNGGSIVLQSKSGSGYTKPTIEFNSYGTYAWWERFSGGLNGTTQPSKDWLLSNSIAYMKDFGLIDLRISYNNQATIGKPYERLGHSPIVHNFKLNMGAQPIKNADVRFILNNQFHKYDSDYITEGGQFPNDTISENGNQNLLHGNLTMKYKVWDWMRLSSQLTFSKEVSSSFISRGDPTSSFINRMEQESDRNDNRTTANVFADFNKQLSKILALSAYTGVQYAKQQADKSWANRNSFQEITGNPERMIKSTSLVLGSELNYKNLWNVNFSLRKTKYEDDFNLENKETSTSNYSFGTSFIFTELLNSKILSFGKIRASMGSNSAIPLLRYSWLDTDLYSSSTPERNRSIEIGTDLLLSKPKIEITINYFRDRFQNKIWETTINEGDKSAVTYLSGENFKFKGWEMDVSLQAFKHKRATYKVGFLLSSQRSRSESDENYSNPYWRGSLQSQVSWELITLSLLIETIDKNANLKSSFTKVRDVSIFYKLPIRTLKLEKAYISVSGRNLYVLSTSGIDEEQFPQKSISLSLTMIF